MARRRALLAVALLAASCTADVGDFDRCLQFFFGALPPKGLAGEPICQRYQNQYHFATLYSRRRRTPWFSAYVFSPPDGKRPSACWKYEPQLAYSGDDGNMACFPQGPLDQNVVESQAVQLDYINSSYTRGHLNPSLHHHSHLSRQATFTLTNVVPQKMGSNDGPWESLENTVNHTLSEYCLGEAHVVTGIIPYKNDDHWLRKGRVAVPEYLWSAYCCPKYTQNLPDWLKDAFPSYAAIGRNDPNSTEEIVPVNTSVKKQFLGYDVLRMPLKTLEAHLKDRLSADIMVFYEHCGASD